VDIALLLIITQRPHLANYRFWAIGYGRRCWEGIETRSMVGGDTNH